ALPPERRGRGARADGLLAPGAPGQEAPGAVGGGGVRRAGRGAVAPATAPGADCAEPGRRVFDRFKLFARAESLGGVESLVCHPASMTHALVPREARLAMGFADGLLRLSVGIEDVEDLLADLDAALEGLGAQGASCHCRARSG